jgi:hypothetical protein
MVFAKEQRVHFAEKANTKDSIKPAQVMTQIGINWAALNPAEQEVFKVRAKQGQDAYLVEKEVFKRENPGWTEPLPKSKKRKVEKPPAKPASALV